LNTIEFQLQLGLIARPFIWLHFGT